MRWLWCLLLALPWLTNAGPVTVKTRSQGLHEERVALNGSGLLLKDSGQQFVLTSEHVVHHAQGESQGVKHQVLIEGKWYGAHLRAVDWGVGLALLEMDTPTAVEGAIEVHELRGADTAMGLIASGYPAATEQLYIDRNGQILNAKSSRHWIPLLDTAIEMVGAHVEFGMSGGPVFTTARGELLGILSHQFVNQTPGRASSVVEFNALVSRHVIMIPGSAALDWVKRIVGLQSPTTPYFLRPLNVESRDRGQVQTSGLVFSLETQASRPEVALAPTGDGAGVGGEVAMVADVGLGLRIELAQADAPETQWYLPARREWIARVKSYLNSQTEVRIPFLIERVPDSGRLRRVGFSSLQEFFVAMKRPSIIPAMVLSGESFGPFNERAAKITRMAMELKEELATLMLALKRNSPSRALIQQLDEVADVAATDGVLLLGGGDLKPLIDVKGGQREGWKELFNLQFDSAVSVLGRLQRLDCVLDYSCRK